MKTITRTQKVLEDGARLGALRRTELLDAPPDAALDGFTEVAYRAARAPMAMFSLLDARLQHVQSAHGLAEPWRSRRQIPLSRSLCKQVIATGVSLRIGDVLEERWQPEGRAVAEMGVRSYLGAPVRFDGAPPIGALCVMDRNPRGWTEEEVAVLARLAAGVEREIEWRRKARELRSREAQLAASEERFRARAAENARLYRDARRAAAAREEIMAVVSHDLRNPLNAIQLAAQLLLEASSDRRSTNQKSLEVIQRASRQMGRLIEDLLEVTTDGSGGITLAPEPLDAGELLRDACGLMERMAAERAITLVCDPDAALPRVAADRDRLLQVLSNLIGNALKFTLGGGEIRVQARAWDDGVRVCVRDSGVGIPSEALPHVFERFWQGDREDHRGAGLGLAIVKQIVEAHGGRIWVESEAGAGTTFCFWLPVHAAA